MGLCIAIDERVSRFTRQAMTADVVKKPAAKNETTHEKPELVTPTTSQVLRDAAPRKPRSGAQLWKTAQHKLHAYHAVTHEVQHRGAEKAFFAFAEHGLETVAHATLKTVHVHTAAAIAHESLSWWQRVGPAAKNVTCRLRELGPAGWHCPVPLPPPPPSMAMRVWSGSLKAVEVALPVAGTALVAHMAHHDYHRAHKEQHKRGLCLTTLLFYVACACDALDALAHAVIVMVLLAGLVLDEHTLHHHHLDHHFAHEVHHAGMLFAICATLAMVAGEVSSVRATPHQTMAQKLLASVGGPKPMAQKLLAAAKKQQ